MSLYTPPEETTPTMCLSPCAAEMKGTAPHKEVLELFSLARSRLDAPLLGPAGARAAS
jgi:hypothetical protein